MAQWRSQRKNAGTTPGAPLHGPGGLLGTLGLGKRRKAEGDEERSYVRSDDGKFSTTPGGGDSDTADKPKPKPKPKPAPKKPRTTAPKPAPPPPADIDHTDGLKQLGLDPKLSDALGEYLSGLNADPPEDLTLNAKAAAALEALGLMKVNPGQEDAGSKNITLTSAGKRLNDAVNAGDIAKGMRVVEAAHTGYDKREAKRQEREAKRAARAAEREAKKREREAKREAKRTATTRPAEKAMRPTRKKTYWAAYRDYKLRGFPAPQARTAARKALRKVDSDRARTAYQRSLKQFSVFKDANNQWRWVAVSSTAYQDRDQEIVSRRALKNAVAYGDRTGDRGPLRWWHIPGFDIGDCDFQATTQDDRFLVESGTFRSPAIAHKVAQHAAQLGLTLGFYHPANEPYGGVFDTIHIFERSLAPKGRVSNHFTHLMVKGSPSMHDEKVKAARELLGDVIVNQLLATVAQTDKTAQQQTVAYKAAEPVPTVYRPSQTALPPNAPAAPTIYYHGDTPGIIANGQFVALKMAPMAAETKAPMPAPTMMAAGATELEDGLAEEMDEDAADDLGGEVIGDMAPEAFRQLLKQTMAELMNEQAASISAIDEQLKGMGYARAKEAGQLAALAEQHASLDQRLKTLEGDQPAAQAYRASQAPSTLIDPQQGAALTEKAATNPFATMFPEVYQ